MQNSYIVDAFLSGAIWMLLIFLSFDVAARIRELNSLITANVLAIAFAQYLKLSLIIAVPFWGLIVFMLWRFYGLMIATQSWGAGGMGLLIAMLLIGLPLAWLQIIFILVKQSSYVSVPVPIRNQSRRLAA